MVLDLDINVVYYCLVCYRPYFELFRRYL